MPAQRADRPLTPHGKEQEGAPARCPPTGDCDRASGARGTSPAFLAMAEVMTAGRPTPTTVDGRSFGRKGSTTLSRGGRTALFPVRPDLNGY